MFILSLITLVVVLIKSSAKK
ncbi:MULTISPECIES: hypothetical protein [Leuconostoc]|nr:MULTISPECIES: hypothetical protein [Leuconostoc]MCQ6659487.1 hypothetical protein [Leuconostoc citreum]